MEEKLIISTRYVRTGLPSMYCSKYSLGYRLIVNGINGWSLYPNKRTRCEIGIG